MSVYLFDLVHLPHFQYEYTEEEFKKDCPEWVGKNWAFVKQMATGFTHVCLYSHKWFVYSRYVVQIIVFERKQIKQN